MLTASEIILEYAFPAAGVVCGNWMFLAPLEDVRKAAVERSLGDLNPIPWAVMLGNTLGWVAYALLRSNWFIFFGNAPGFFFSIYFNLTAIKLLYAETLSSDTAITTSSGTTPTIPTQDPLAGDAVPKVLDDQPTSMALADPLISASNTNALAVEPTPSPASLDSKLVEDEHDDKNSTASTAATSRLIGQERLLLFVILLWMGVISCVVASKNWDDDLRQMVVGIVVNGNLVFFYGAPLSIIRRVLTTRSSRWLHGPTMLRNTANGVFWSAYGFAVLDWYVAIPNTLGALLGVVQMILWVIFPRGASQEENAIESDRTRSTTKVSTAPSETKISRFVSTTAIAMSLAPAASAWIYQDSRLSRRRMFSPLYLAPQQLGSFESLNIDPSAISDRIVRLESKLDSLVSYDQGLARQRELWQAQADRLATDPTSTSFGTCSGCDTVLILQHSPVFTLGTASDESFIHGNEDEAVPVERINRGGEVTYHGPGQLTVYPILDLRHYNQDIHWYVRALEEVVIRSLRKVGIADAVRDDETTGVWVQNHKVAAVGVHVRKWITQHGLAINVTPDSLVHFSKIVPCGLYGRPVGTVQQFCPDSSVSMDEMAVAVKSALEETFKIKLQHVTKF